MSLTFHCPKCGKQYSNIRQDLIGKKARCACGKVLRLGEQLQDEQSLQPTTPPASSSDKADSFSPIAHHYSDLDSILAGSVFEAEPAGVTRPSTSAPIQPTTQRPNHPTASRQSKVVREPTRIKPNVPPQSVPTKPSSTKTTISFLAVVVSASLAFWFGLLIVVSRFTTVDQILLHPFSIAVGNLNAGRFGLDEMAPGLKIGFVICGWAIWTVAATMVLFAPLQLFNAVAQLFVRRQIFRLIDGLMATCGVLLVFLLVATLFLHASHMANLNRQLNQFDSPQAIAAGASERQNVQRIREQYQADSRSFMTVILAGGLVPLSIFSCSMLRLLTSQFHGPRLSEP
jgi:hypothetical protein